MLRTEGITWQNVYYHYQKWSRDGSFKKLFETSKKHIVEQLALECLQIDGTHTPAKKGVKMLHGKQEKE